MFVNAYIGIAQESDTLICSAFVAMNFGYRVHMEPYGALSVRYGESQPVNSWYTSVHPTHLVVPS